MMILLIFPTLGKHQDTERPLVGVTYFVRDKKKEGGAYFTKIGNARYVDEIGRKILFTDGTLIPLDDVVSVEGEVFEEMY